MNIIERLRYYGEIVPSSEEMMREASDEIEQLRAELAASQAREKVLREMFLITIEFGAIPPISFDEVKKQFLRLQQDDTALRQAIRAAKEEMRERCAKVCDVTHERHSEKGHKKEATTAHAIRVAIRMLEVEVE